MPIFSQDAESKKKKTLHLLNVLSDYLKLDNDQKAYKLVCLKYAITVKNKNSFVVDILKPK